MPGAPDVEAGGALPGPPGPAAGTIYRSMSKPDISAVRYIHEQCLPVRYNTEFYENIVEHVVQRSEDGPREAVHTLVAVLPWEMQHANTLIQCADGAMVGLITAQLSQLVDYCSASDVIGFADPSRHDKVAYILTLGVLEEYRRAGVGAALLARCIETACADERCGAVYLHVITYNTAAMAFYERAGFVRLTEVEGYYMIARERHNCYVYVLFVNGATRGEPRRLPPPPLPPVPAHPHHGHSAGAGIMSVVSGRLRQLVSVLRRWILGSSEAESDDHGGDNGRAGSPRGVVPAEGGESLA